MSAYIMTFLSNVQMRLREEQEGQTLVEYTLVIALMVIALAVVFTASGLDTKVSSVLSNLKTKF